MINCNSIEQFPFRLEILDLETNESHNTFPSTKDEIFDRIKLNDNEKLFLTGWERSTGQLIAESHPDETPSGLAERPIPSGFEVQPLPILTDPAPILTMPESIIPTVPESVITNPEPIATMLSEVQMTA